MSIEDREALLFESQGQKLFAITHTPQNRTKDFIVIFVHGFGGNKIGFNRRNVLIAKALVDAGIAALRFDFRGCGDSEGEFADMTLHSQIHDLNTVVEDILKKYRKIVLLGCSLGGTICQIIATQKKEVKGLILLAPIASHNIWSESYEMAKKKFPSKSHLDYKGRIVNKIFFEEFFEVNFENLARNCSHLPLLHVHGYLDNTVPFDHATLMQKWRQTSNQKTQFLPLEQSDHHFNHQEEQKKMIQAIVQWCQELE